MKRKLKVFAFKLIRVIGRFFYRRRIWLINDRAMLAGDKGEAFFRFLSNKDVDAVFAIKRKSPDYERVKKYGEVVEYESLKHKFLSSVCDCHIGSITIHMDDHEEAPQIFLQHGVIFSDCSSYLNPASHDKFYILTSAEKEKNGLCTGRYTIKNDNIWLTGLPRFDYLNDNSKKKIVIIFSWRTDIPLLTREEVLNSLYVRTILRIFDDERINRVLKDAGYELYIKLHPEVQILESILPERIKNRIYRESFNKLYEEASLLITDYSSAISDFVYLNKPVLYYHFDNGEYYNGPFKAKGDYDYEKEGFGPVTYSFDEFVKELEKIINSDCIMEEKYKDRVDKFFAYHDRNNCERVYQNIKRLIG
jgi:hypothetical protein